MIYQSEKFTNFYVLGSTLAMQERFSVKLIVIAIHLRVKYPLMECFESKFVVM
jgi:hypothetical protein